VEFGGAPEVLFGALDPTKYEVRSWSSSCFAPLVATFSPLELYSNCCQHCSNYSLWFCSV
jgi:hypothetical protein